ncbi:MAG: T9SS type A sorting domain-containing protein [Bacteroidales bacterium]
MKKFYTQFLLMMLLAVLLATQGYSQVNVSTGGSPTTYANIKLAFDAINAGTHTGTIVIDITGSGTYTDPSAPAVLNSSGAGSASYTSVLIRPTADGVNIFATTVLGRGVIELKGADNVTIDGDNPNTPGTNRNLTIYHNAAATINYTSVVRICNTATVVASSDNITIKNCVIRGNASGGNLSTITSTTGSSNTTFGIYCGGNGGATAIDAPTAIASVTTNTAPSGTTINNLTVDNNAVSQCARGIVFNGAASTVSTGVTITNNVLGTAYTQTGAPPFTSPTSTVYTKGIWMNGLTAATITGNTIQNILSYVGTTMTAIETVGAIGAGSLNISGNTINTVVNNAASTANGIQLASASGTYTISGNTISSIQAVGSSCSALTIATTATSGTIASNFITTVRARSTGGVRAGGIVITGGNAVTIQNNFIAEVLNIGSASFGNSFNANGILLAAGNNHKVYYNSVNLYGVSASAGSNSINCFAITANTQTGIDVRNNIFSNTVTGGAATDAHTCVFLPFAASASMLLTLNNNAYYTGSIAGKSGVAFAGVTSYAAANVYSAANFSAGSNSPATNFRSYSTALGVATNDNASFASTTAAPFTSATDLHIPALTSTQIESGGVVIAGTTTDIDAQNRYPNAGYPNNPASPAAAPDMGADEFGGTKVDLNFPSIVYTPLVNTTFTGARTLIATITDPSGVGDLTNQPVLYWKINAGAYTGPVSPTSVSGNDYTFTFGSGVVATDVVAYFIVAQDKATPPNVGSAPSGATVTASPPAASAGPATPSTYIILGTICGNKTVGAGGTYSTITAALADLNIRELCGPLTLTLLDASYASETLPLVINPNTGSSAVNIVTIKPNTGVSPSITGALASAPVFKILNNYVIIDGSNTAGGTTRDLTITNSNATAPNVMVIGSTGTTTIVGVTLKNCVLINGVNTSSALIISDGTTPGAAGYFNNITIQNNSIQKAYIGMYVNAAVVAGNGSVLITENLLNTAGTNSLAYTGIYVQGADGAIVSKNKIANFDGTGSEDDRGIWFATGTVNSTIEKNYISDLNYTGTGGYGGYGIAVSTGVTGCNIKVKNNMIYHLSGDGWAQSTLGDNTHGIYLFSTQTGVKVYDNSINLYGNTINKSGAYSYGITLGTGTTADIKGNIIVNNLGLLSSTGTGSIGIFLQTSNTQLEGSDYNDIFVNPTGSGVKYIGMIGATGYTTLLAWQTASGKDAHSISGDPKFLSNTNLHIDPVAVTPINDAGVTLAAVTDDIDGNPRNTPPDMGADEIQPPPCTGAVGGTAVAALSAICGSGNPGITCSGFSTGSGSTYQWQYSNDNFVSDVHDFTGQVNPTALTTGVISASNYYRLKVTCSENISTSYSNNLLITATPLPTISVTPAGPVSICTPNTQLLTATTNAASPAYQWQLNGVNIDEQNTSEYTAAASGNYSIIVNDAATECSNTATVVVAINPLPSALTISPEEPISVTAGGIQMLTANGGVVTGISLLNENFNGVVTGWSAVNNSTGGNPTVAAWNVQNDAYFYNSETFHSNDNSKFYMTNSDAQGSGGTTNTILTAPVVNTMGFTTLNLAFYDYFKVYTSAANDSVVVEVSTNNITWLRVLKYSGASHGSASGFAAENVNLNSYINKATLYVRFHYTSAWGYYWAIDNVSITGDKSTTISWSPLADLYTNAGATLAYDGTGDAPNIYTKPVTSRTYTATATSTSGCTSSQSVLVTSCPAVPGSPSVSYIAPTSFKLSWEYTTGNQPVNYTIDVATDALFALPVVGSPFTVAYPGLSLTISGLSPSTLYHYRVKANVVGCSSDYTTPGSVMTLCPAVIAPFTEGFESAGFAPDCWTNSATSGSFVWERTTAASGHGVGTASATANFFNQAAGTYELTTMPFDASALTTPTLRFDYAYATYVVEIDEMDVYYSTDFGTTWNSLLNMPGGQTGILNTAGATEDAFIPTSSQWDSQTLALPAGTNMLKFTAVSAYGNNLYLDNIRVTEGVPETNTVQNVTVANGETICYNATNSIVVAGPPTTFVVETGGNATFIAGETISFLPGTTVQSGGYMHGYISTGSYCGDKAPVLPAVVKSSTEEAPVTIEQANFSIYPNPTNSNFTLVQKGDRAFGSVKIEVYNIRGAKVMTEQMIGEKAHVFSFTEMPTGLYFVKVVADDYVETIKLVKTR